MSEIPGACDTLSVSDFCVCLFCAVNQKECGLWRQEWASHCLGVTWCDFWTSVADKRDHTSVANGKVKEEPVCVSVF